MSADQSGRNPRGVKPLLWLILITGATLPWLVGLAVRLVLESQGEPLIPWSYFFGNLRSSFLSLLLLPWCATPYLLLWFVGRDRISAASKEGDFQIARRRFWVVSTSFGVMVAYSIPHYVAIWKEYEFLLILFGFLQYPAVGAILGAGAAIAAQRVAAKLRSLHFS